jgi:hypothetical protein
VMMFRSYTQFSKGKTNSLSVQVIQNSWDGFINVMAVFVPIIHLLMQWDHLI